jgi:hypothetical protein
VNSETYCDPDRVKWRDFRLELLNVEGTDINQVFCENKIQKQIVSDLLQPLFQAYQTDNPKPIRIRLNFCWTSEIERTVRYNLKVRTETQEINLYEEGELLFNSSRIIDQLSLRVNLFLAGIPGETVRFEITSLPIPRPKNQSDRSPFKLWLGLELETNTSTLASVERYWIRYFLDPILNAIPGIPNRNKPKVLTYTFKAIFEPVTARPWSPSGNRPFELV